MRHLDERVWESGIINRKVIPDSAPIRSVRLALKSSELIASAIHNVSLRMWTLEIEENVGRGSWSRK